MNRKVFLILLLVMIVSLMGAIIYTNKDKNNSYSNKELGSNLAIMVYDKETGGYVKQDNIPSGRYQLNKDKSICTAGNKIGDYDATNGTISYMFNTADECYLYFDPRWLETNFDQLDEWYSGNELVNFNAKMLDNKNYTFIILAQENSTYELEKKIENKAEVNCTYQVPESADFVFKIIIQDVDGNLVDEELSRTMNSYCFVSGTKILTSLGYKNVEDIAVDDEVYSYNLDNNSRELKKVTGLIQSQSHFITKVKVESREIEMSNRHQIYIIDKGWVRGKDLKAGDKMLNTEGNIVTIDKVEQIYFEEEVPTYNFTVEDNHNYYVSDLQVLVHNISHAYIENPDNLNCS